MTLGDWTPLPGGVGDTLAASGALSASLSGTRAVVWEGDRVAASVHLEGGPAGIARFVGGRLHFGPGWIEEGRWTALPAPAPTVHGGVRASAWSRDGCRVALLVDGPRTPGGGGGPSSLLVERRADGGGSRVAADPGAAAVWVSDTAVVGIGRELRVWDAAGERAARPAHEGGGVVSVSASRDEAWLLTVGTDGTALLWDTASWASTRWPGAWVGGALSPDGEWAVGIDVRGSLHAARRTGAELAPAGALPVAGVRTLVLDDARILASFNEAPFHRMATLHPPALFVP